MGAGRLRDEILDLIEERSGKGERSAERLPEGEDRVTFLNHLVHQGALEKTADKTFRCPIPSFRTYLIHKGGLDPNADPEASPAHAGDDGPDLSS